MNQIEVTLGDNVTFHRGADINFTIQESGTLLIHVTAGLDDNNVEGRRLIGAHKHWDSVELQEIA